MYGIKVEAPSAPRGTDLVILLDFSASGISDFTEYRLEAVLKQDIYCNSVEWLGELGDGLVYNNGQYYAIIPQSVADSLPTAVHYLAVTAAKQTQIVDIEEKKIVVYTQTLNILPNAASVGPTGAPVNAYTL